MHFALATKNLLELSYRQASYWAGSWRSRNDHRRPPVRSLSLARSTSRRRSRAFCCRSVVSKTMIMEHVWDYNFDPQTNVVESRICRLRDKIDKGFDTPLIHTVRGMGYVLKDTP